MGTDEDGHTLTYRVTGGADQLLFLVDSNTGELAFQSPPDYESPGGANQDNS
jgi:hypothetical protein